MGVFTVFVILSVFSRCIIVCSQTCTLHVHVFHMHVPPCMSPHMAMQSDPLHVHVFHAVRP